MEKKNKFILFKFLKYVFKSYKGFPIFLVIKVIFSTLESIFTAYSLSLIIGFIENGKEKEALIGGAIVALISFILLAINSFFNQYDQYIVYKSEEKVLIDLNKKYMSLPFSYLEDPYYMELSNNAKEGINNQGAISGICYNICNLFSSLFTVISLLALVGTFDYKIVLILVIGVIFNLIVSILSKKSVVKFFNKINPINFKYWYYLETLNKPSNGKDFRMYKSYDVLFKNFKEFTKNVNKEITHFYFLTNFYEILSLIISNVIMGLIYIVIGVKTISEKLTISKLSLTISASINFSNAINSFISSIGDIQANKVFIAPLVEIMDIKEEREIGDKKLDSIESIEFKNVYFTYPHTEKIVLEDVSFKINKNEKISLVGLNGAGKTTIVKLLSRLYKIDKGEILINGISIYDYDIDSYISCLSSVYQDFKLFNYSILENIRPDIKKEEGEEILKDVGIYEKINSLNKGIESSIGKSLEKDGVELSGGQFQKIAIARCLAKTNSSLLILDEPTSALDPLAEAEIYENFNNLSKDKTSIYISHRMASSVFCDKVLVLNNGKIEDFAPHHELMKKTDSLYYKLFTSQAKNYELDRE